MDTSVSLLAPPSRTSHVWTHTEIEKLIELIQTKECLWKINSFGCNSLIRKNLALKEIGIEINIPFDDVKEESRKLRSKLLTEIKLVKTNQINMPTIECKSKWKYFESLQFMVDDIKANPGKRLSSSFTTTNSLNSNLILKDKSADHDDHSVESKFNNQCICQLCLSTVNEDTFFVNLSTQYNQRETINDIVLKYFNFTQPNTIENDSKNICIVCWQMIKEFHKYSTKIRMVQDRFKKHNENVYTTSINIEEGNQIKNEKIINNCDNVESNLLVQSQADISSFENDEDTIFENANSNSNSSEVEMCKDNQLLSLPKNFDQQIRTEGLLKRYRQIRPVLMNDSKTFDCNFCDKTYEKISSAYSHIQIHPLPYVCPEGDKRFRNFTDGIKHIKNEHKNKIHKDSAQICAICGQMLKSKTSLSLHIETVHRPANQPKVQCKICGTRLRDANILRIHIKRQHLVDKVAVKCDQCSIILSSVDRLKFHKRKYHDNYMKTHKCTICEKTFHAKTRLKEHIGSIHGGGGEPLYKCDFCPKTFNVKSNSYTHRRRMHPKEHQEIIDKREAEKIICNENQANVNDEIDDAITSFKHKCKMCPEIFKFKKYLIEHTLSVHKNKNSGTKALCN